MLSIEEVAAAADVIINGYAVRACKEGVRVDNLNAGGGSAVFRADGTLIETNMDDIELSIAKDYMSNAQKYMEVANA